MGRSDDSGFVHADFCVIAEHTGFPCRFGTRAAIEATAMARRDRRIAIVNDLIKEVAPGLMYNDDRESLATAIVIALDKEGL